MAKNPIAQMMAQAVAPGVVRAPPGKVGSKSTKAVAPPKRRPEDDPASAEPRTSSTPASEAPEGFWRRHASAGQSVRQVPLEIGDRQLALSGWGRNRFGRSP